LKEAHAKRNDRQDVINAAYSIVRKQCSDAQWNLVESHKDHAEVQAKMDVIGLLKLIRNALYSGATTRNSCVSAQDAMVKLFTFRQSKTMENADYLKKFKELTELVAFNGTIIGVKETRVTDMIKEIAKDKNVPTEDEYEKAKDMAQEQFHAILLIRHADKNRFGELIAYLENSFTMGEDRYPRTVTKAYEILVNYKKFVQHAHDASEHGMSYHTKQTDNNETHVPREDRNHGGRGGRGTGRAGRGRGRGAGRGIRNNVRGGDRNGEYHLLEEDTDTGDTNNGSSNTSIP